VHVLDVVWMSSVLLVVSTWKKVDKNKLVSFLRKWSDGSYVNYIERLDEVMQGEDGEENEGS
jgi:hypothetical protein